MKQFKVGLREVTSKIGAELGYPDWWFDCEELAQDRIGNISIPAIDDNLNTLLKSFEDAIPAELYPEFYPFLITARTCVHVPTPNPIGYRGGTIAPSNPLVQVEIWLI